MSDVSAAKPEAAAADKPVYVPRWLVRTIWIAHRAAYSITRGRFGLRLQFGSDLRRRPISSFSVALFHDCFGNSIRK